MYPAEAPKYSASDTVLAGLGLPTKNGHLDWPIALDALPHSEDARRQVESAMVALAAYKGNANAGLVDEAKRSLDRLRDLVYSNRYSMTAGTRKEADRFLDKLESALKAFQY
jgi:hypothetical protein